MITQADARGLLPSGNLGTKRRHRYAMWRWLKERHDQLLGGGRAAGSGTGLGTGVAMTERTKEDYTEF